MKILVIGSGGREHALVWKLKQCEGVDGLFCAPGNPGIAELAQLVPIKVSDLSGLLGFAVRENIDLTVVGPEQPLADGIVDLFEKEKLPIFGPSRRAAELEWSKAFAKEFMRRHGIPTASYRVYGRDQAEEARSYLSVCPLPVVLKADGLAAGKGVIICPERKDAMLALEQFFEAQSFGTAGDTVVVEEFLEGEEASVFALSDGESFLTLAPAQDHKRVFDGDRGKNTGGMGAYAPTPLVTERILDDVRLKIIEPSIRGMAADGREYRGCLYVGLMLTESGPRVVEYNCRFGDPETQAVLPLLDADLAGLLLACTHRGGLKDFHDARGNVPWSGAAVCVVLASAGYPDAYSKGKEIVGLDRLAAIPDVVAFHAGTALKGRTLVTAGGRVLGITALARHGTLGEAITRAYEAVQLVRFEGRQFRRDIGKKALVH